MHGETMKLLNDMFVYIFHFRRSSRIIHPGWNKVGHGQLLLSVTLDYHFW